MFFEPRPPEYFGKYKGFVRDNADPERRGRIRVYCPQVMGADSDHREGWLGWAEPCFPWLGGLSAADFGVPYTKEQNAGEEVGVWVEFEGGNPDLPVWVGTWTVAPLLEDSKVQLNEYAAAGFTGGSLIEASAGAAAIAPPVPLPEKETRLLVKAGRDIVIGSKDGGYIIIGPSGIQLTGVFVRVNGRAIDASADKVFG